MPEVTPPLFQDVNAAYSGDELGLPYRDIVKEGYVTGLAVTQRGIGANLSVDVALGSCWVKGDSDTARQPTYRCRSDSTVNLVITPDPTNPRKVLIIAEVLDNQFDATGSTLWRLRAVHGTPAGSPTEPALPISAIPLALIDVTANDTDITNAQITDRRVPAQIGGDIPAGSNIIYDSGYLTASQATFDIQNIPAIYTHLRLVALLRNDQALTSAAVLMRFNNDVGSNYADQMLQGANATVSAAEVNSATSIQQVVGCTGANALANAFWSGDVLIPFYAGATLKNAQGLVYFAMGMTTGTRAPRVAGGIWNSAAAINRITLSLAAGLFVAGSRVVLYGVV